MVLLMTFAFDLFLLSLTISGTTGPNAHPGNMRFRDMIRENKPRYDALVKLSEREALSEQLWIGLRDNHNTRFLRPSVSDPKNVYEILDHERSVKKILHALRDLDRTRGPPRKGKAGKVTNTKKVRWNPTVASAEEKGVDFEMDFRAEMKKLHQNDTLLEAMKTSWKDEFDVKKKLFEDQVRLIGLLLF